MTDTTADNKSPEFIRTYSDELADLVVSKGGQKTLVHEFDEIRLWDCTVPSPDFLKSEEYMQCQVAMISRGTQLIFQRIRPEIYTIGSDGDLAFGEMQEKNEQGEDTETLSLMLSRTKKKLLDSVDDGEAILISNWVELQEILNIAKEEGVRTVSVILGEGSDEQEYMESYGIQTALLIANSLVEDN